VQYRIKKSNKFPSEGPPCPLILLLLQYAVLVKCGTFSKAHEIFTAFMQLRDISIQANFWAKSSMWTEVWNLGAEALFCANLGKLPCYCYCCSIVASTLCATFHELIHNKES
jgi:hypothetical protein